MKGLVRGRRNSRVRASGQGLCDGQAGPNAALHLADLASAWRDGSSPARLSAHLIGLPAGSNPIGGRPSDVGRHPDMGDRPSAREWHARRCDVIRFAAGVGRHRPALYVTANATHDRNGASLRRK